MSNPTNLPETDIVQAARIVEALVFASAKAVPIKSVLPFLQDETQLPKILELIKSRYDKRSGLSFEISSEQLAFRTKAVKWLGKISGKKGGQLTPARCARQ